MPESEPLKASSDKEFFQSVRVMLNDPAGHIFTDEALRPFVLSAKVNAVYLAVYLVAISKGSFQLAVAVSKMFPLPLHIADLVTERQDDDA